MGKRYRVSSSAEEEGRGYWFGSPFHGRREGGGCVRQTCKSRRRGDMYPAYTMWCRESVGDLARQTQYTTVSLLPVPSCTKTRLTELGNQHRPLHPK